MIFIISTIAGKPQLCVSIKILQDRIQITMEILQFHFNHPVTGKVRLYNPEHPSETKVVFLSEQDGELISIPLKGLTRGQWRATLEWEYDGRDFYHEQMIDLPGKP